MAIPDLYQPSTGNYNTSSHIDREPLSQDQAYYEPEVLMAGSVWVSSGRQAWQLMPKPAMPPQVVAPILDATALAERIARQVGSVRSMETVHITARPWGFECWLVADGSTEQERFWLYDLEWEWMESAPGIGFKFHLVDRLGHPLSEVLTLEPVDAVAAVRKV